MTVSRRRDDAMIPRSDLRVDGLKPKDLVGIPWRVAFALQADGWYLRQDIIWHKPNPMPESVRDRCTKAHEYLFLLAKSERYYFDAEAIAEPAACPEGPGNLRQKYTEAYEAGDERLRTKAGLVDIGPRDTRNKRSVWTVTTQPFKEAHFATFPPALIEPCILAGTSARGCCPTCRAPWVLDTGRPCEKCSAFIPFQGKFCEACGHVKDWKAERGISESLVADDWSTPGKSVPRKLGESGKQGAVPPQEKMDRGWKPSCKCEDQKPEPCTVLDLFGGAGTTGLVADRLGRNAILIELNPAYAAMAQKRIKTESPLFADVV